MIKQQEIKTKVIEDNIIHVSVIYNDDNGYKYERVYYLDFNKLTNTEHMISIEHDNWLQRTGQESTKVRLTFQDIPISKLTKWKEDDDLGTAL